MEGLRVVSGVLGRDVSGGPRRLQRSTRKSQGHFMGFQGKRGGLRGSNGAPWGAQGQGSQRRSWCLRGFQWSARRYQGCLGGSQVAPGGFYGVSRALIETSGVSGSRESHEWLQWVPGGLKVLQGISAALQREPRVPGGLQSV